VSLRTPLGRVLGLGAAKDGTGHFVGQRITAIAVALLGSWFAWSLASLDSMTYLDVIRFIRGPANSVLLMLLVAAVSYHSFLGVQVVIEDYLHGAGSKLLALIVSRFAHIIVAVASAFAILRIGFTT
jgi:succinate dehydrogenase / fumarate reductase membrane anchor subunit